MTFHNANVECERSSKTLYCDNNVQYLQMIGDGSNDSIAKLGNTDLSSLLKLHQVLMDYPQHWLVELVTTMLQQLLHV